MKGRHGRGHAKSELKARRDVYNNPDQGNCDGNQRILLQAFSDRGPDGGTGIHHKLMLRKFIPKEARIVSYICIIATFVTCVDYIIMALSIELHRALGAFIALIVVNCLILGRSEAFASKNKPGRAMLDGLGMGVGFTLALLFIGIVREVLGSGTLFGVSLFPDGFQTWTIMVLPSGGFLAMAGWLLIVNWLRQKEDEAAKRAAQAGS